MIVIEQAKNKKIIKILICLAILLMSAKAGALVARADDSTMVVTDSIEYEVVNKFKLYTLDTTGTGVTTQYPSSSNDYVWIMESHAVYKQTTSVPTGWEIKKIVTFSFPILASFSTVGASPRYGTTISGNSDGTFSVVTSNISTGGETFRDISDSEISYVSNVSLLNEKMPGFINDYNNIVTNIQSAYPQVHVSTLDENAYVLHYQTTDPSEFMAVVASDGEFHWKSAQAFGNYVNVYVDYFRGIDVTFSTYTDVSVTRPDDYSITLGDDVTFDSTITSVDADGTTREWYGTFQILKPGGVWEDVDSSFMNTTTTDGNPSFTLNAPDMSYNGAQVRYKYVHVFDDAREVISHLGNLEIIDPNAVTNPKTQPPNTGVNDYSPIYLIAVVSSLVTISRFKKRENAM